MKNIILTSIKFKGKLKKFFLSSYIQQRLHSKQIKKKGKKAIWWVSDTVIYTKQTNNNKNTETNINYITLLLYLVWILQWKFKVWLFFFLSRDTSIALHIITIIKKSDGFFFFFFRVYDKELFYCFLDAIIYI